MVIANYVLGIILGPTKNVITLQNTQILSEKSPERA